MSGPGPGTASDIRIAGSRVFPESITSDSLGTLYVGSNGGTIYRALSGEAEAAAWIAPDAVNGLQSVFGVFADDARGLLWVCSNPNGLRSPPETGPSRLKAFDLASGALRADHVFPGNTPALCNDIATAPDGTVFATDTIGGRIVTLAQGAAELAEFAVSDSLRGVDGIAFGGDGTLYINNVQSNLLQRVEREGGRFAGLTDIVTTLPLSGPDGLRSIGGNRFLQAEGTGGRVALLTIEGDRAQMIPLVTGLDFPAAVTLVGRTAYVPEGKIAYLFDPARREEDPGPFVIHAVRMPEGR
jgi:sugar lactone lactonase YvrE